MTNTSTAIIVLCCMLFAAALAQTNKEVQVLCDIKTKLNPFLWRSNAHSPCEMETPCQYTFSGVVCDEKKEHVIKLNLYANAMEGEFPASITDLTSLQVLDVSENRLTGTLPDLSSLKDLNTIDVSRTLLESGSVPTWLCDLNLNAIGFSHTHRTGPLPDCLYALSVNSLSFSGNDITGNVERLFQNTKLRSIDISDNPHLTPLRIGELFCGAQLSALTHFHASNANLEGELSDCVNTTLTALSSLDLSSNRLSGVLPESMFSQMTELVSLSLGSNQFTGDFNGNIKAEVCDVSYNDLICVDGSCGCKVAQGYNGYDPKYSPTNNAIIISFCVISAVAFIAVFGFLFYREYRKSNANEYHQISE